MRQAGLQGALRSRRFVTTKPDPGAQRPPDRVNRDFSAAAPNRLWIVDFTYVPTWSGMAFTAFVSDVFSRRIVGWRTSCSMPIQLPLDALEMALWTRGRAGHTDPDGRLDGLIHHSDAGSQYTAIRYADRLADAGALASIGSVGDSFDNAMAESVIGLYKTECVRHDGPFRSVDDLELATLSWVHWFNTARLHSSLERTVPPPRAREACRASAIRSTPERSISRNRTERKNVVMTALIETSSDRWTRMIRSTGVVGLITFVVLFTALITSTPGEPTFLASPEEALAFYLNSTAGWVQAAMAVMGLAAIGWIWFVVGLCLLLARAEGSPPWRSAVALVCGVILAAFLLLNTSGDAASFGAADLDLAVASYAFDVISLGLANVWLAIGGFAVCSGWVVVSTRVVGRWLGWWAIASGLGLVIARFFWTSMIWLLPYAAFWIWMVIMCIQLVRKPRAVLKAADGRASPSGERP